MEEIQSFADTHKSLSLSSSPTNPMPSTLYCFLRKPGTSLQMRLIAFEDPPEWDDGMEAEAGFEIWIEGEDNAWPSPEHNSGAGGFPYSLLVDSFHPKRRGGAQVWLSRALLGMHFLEHSQSLWVTIHNTHYN